MTRPRSCRLWCALLCVPFLTLVGSGCQKPVHPHRTIYRFENVRASPVDEWIKIRSVLEEHAGGEITERKSNRRSVAGKDLVDYEVEFSITRVRQLDKIQQGLDKVMKDKYGPNGIDYPLITSELTYRSNFIAVGAEIMIRGFTSPGSEVELRVGERTYRVRADADGAWSQLLALAPNRPFVYGYSQDRAGAKRFFRLNILSMREESISEKTYRDVYPLPKRAKQ